MAQICIFHQVSKVKRLASIEYRKPTLGVLAMSTPLFHWLQDLGKNYSKSHGTLAILINYTEKIIGPCFKIVARFRWSFKHRHDDIFEHLTPIIILLHIPSIHDTSQTTANVEVALKWKPTIHCLPFGLLFN